MHYLARFIEAAATGALGGSPDPSVAASVAADEGVAHTTYAECLQSIGDPANAAASLEQYLGKVARGRDPQVRWHVLRGGWCCAVGRGGVMGDPVWRGANIGGLNICDLRAAS